MSIDTWATKVTQAMHVVPGERPPFAAILVDFIDEFDQLQAKTKMSVPVFARALTAAGLRSASGGKCDPNALRMQIKRARERRDEQRAAAAEKSVSGPPVDLGAVAQARRSTGASGKGRSGSARADLPVLKQLERSKPIKVRRFDDED